MWALVESDNVTQVYTRPKGLTIGEVNYPSNIFMLWTSSELEAIGIYEVVIDNTNLKDPEYYINTNQSFNFASGTVTASYGTATAKAINDVLFTAQDETDGLGTEDDVKTEGLKTKLIRDVKLNAANELAKTDWYVVRKSEESTAIPSAITTHRRLVRSRQAAMETSITNASDTPALETLYTYTRDSDGVSSRPLAEIPIL